jgi:hypothetical protein
MRFRAVCHRLTMASMVLPLAACDSQFWAGRYGPPPAVHAQLANNTITNQLLVLQYIVTDARIPIEFGRPTDPNWYSVAQWGFNIGREDCSIYMAELFRLARERQRNNGLLLDISGAATAIVTAVSPHALALSIIAPAFGLAGNINDKVLNTYLFTEAPGIISQKVKDLQDKYQQVISDNQRQINTSAAAYSAIQGYYNLCLPQSIEGVLLEKIAGPNAVATSPGGTKGAAANSRGLESVARPVSNIPPRISLQ